jgi:hypothetical protein
MQAIARDSFTEAEILAAIHSPNVVVDTRFDLLDENRNLIGPLATVISGSVVYNYDASPALRVIQIELDYPIGYTIDTTFWNKKRIQPWYRLYLPRTNSSGRNYVEYSLGVYRITKPTKGVNPAGNVTIKGGGFDLSHVLAFNRTERKYRVGRGEKYTDAAIEIMNLPQIALSYNIAPSTETLPKDLDWEADTSYLDIVVDLLKNALNYEIGPDENGVFVGIPWGNPLQRASGYHFQEGATSIMDVACEEVVEETEVVNTREIIIQDPNQQDPIIEETVNNNQNSPIANPHLGTHKKTLAEWFGKNRVLPPKRDIAKEVTEREVTRDIRNHKQIDLRIGPFPFFGHPNVVDLTRSDLGYSAQKFLVGSYEIPFIPTQAQSIRLDEILPLN